MGEAGGLRVGCHCILIDVLQLIYSPSVPAAPTTSDKPDEPENTKKRRVANGRGLVSRDLSRFLKRSGSAFKKTDIGPRFRGQRQRRPTEAPSSLSDERFGGHWTSRVDKLTQDFFQGKFHLCHAFLFPTVRCPRPRPTSGSAMEIFSLSRRNGRRRHFQAPRS